jgi:ketosteroid isomerase-like protein
MDVTQKRSPLSIARLWMDAFNAHDLEQLLSLYDDSAQHYSPKLKIRQPETGGLIKGKDSLRAWWKDSFSRLPSLKYEPIQFTADEYRVFMEYIRHVDGEPDMLVGEVLEVDKSLIFSSRVYHG